MADTLYTTSALVILLRAAWDLLTLYLGRKLPRPPNRKGN